MTGAVDARPLSGARVSRSFADRFDVPRRVVLLAALSMVAIVVLMLAFIAWNGVQIFFSNGIPFADVFSTAWFPSSDSNPTYGILPFVVGTIGVTALAIVIATPLAVGLALYMSDVAPAWAREIVQPSLEVFVGIPSVVWGWLGIETLVPFLRENFHQLGFTLGFSWFAGSLVLTIMILPTVTSVSYDAIRSVSDEMRVASLALGTTRWQTLRHVVIPSSLAGILTGVVLGMTRAAGEALAVQMVIGNRPSMPTSVTQPMSTLTSQITQDMGNTVAGEPWNNALWTMAAVLLAISLFFVLVVRILNRRRMAALTS